MKKNQKHPMQPIAKDDDGIVRFKPNKIVLFLLDWARTRGMDLNTLAMIPFDDDDRQQFAQLIGYSVSGFGDLSYVPRDIVAKADKEAEKLD